MFYDAFILTVFYLHVCNRNMGYYTFFFFFLKYFKSVVACFCTCGQVTISINKPTVWTANTGTERLNGVVTVGRYFIPAGYSSILPTTVFLSPGGMQAVTSWPLTCSGLIRDGWQ